MFIEQIKASVISEIAVHTCEENAVYDVRQNISGLGLVCDTCQICGKYVNCRYYSIENECAEIAKRREEIFNEIYYDKCVECKKGEPFKTEFLEFNKCEDCLNKPSLWQRIKGWFR